MRFPKISFKIHALSQVRWKNNPTPPRKTSTMAKNLQTYVSCFVEAILRYSFSLPFRVLAFLVFWGSKKTHPWFLELERDFFGQNSIFQHQQKIMPCSMKLLSSPLKPFEALNVSFFNCCGKFWRNQLWWSSIIPIHWAYWSLLEPSMSIYLNRNIHVNCVETVCQQGKTSRPTTKEYI